jgi:hypothetical protein
MSQRLLLSVRLRKSIRLIQFLVYIHVRVYCPKIREDVHTLAWEHHSTGCLTRQIHRPLFIDHWVANGTAKGTATGTHGNTNMSERLTITDLLQETKLHNSLHLT